MISNLKQQIKTYDKYKDSGIEWIGEIPAGWDICRLKNYAQICNGQDVKNVECENGAYPVIGSGGKFARSNSFLYESESVLLGRKGTIDKPLHINTPFWTVDTMYYTKLSPNTFGKFFYYLCSTINFGYYQYGSAVPSMTQRDLNNVYFPSIDKSEQQQIADYLDEKCGTIDETIAKEKLTIEKLKEYKQSTITEAVTKGLDKTATMKDSGIEWIGKIPQHWDAQKLKYKFRIKKDIAGKEGFDILSVTQRGLKIKDISSNEGQLAMDYSKYQLVNPTDFVMNHMDLLTGWVDCSIYQGVTSPDYRVFFNSDKNNCLNEYYKYIFQSCYKNKIFYGLGAGASDLGRWRLQADKFLNFFIPVPPYREQVLIANFITNMCSEIEKTISTKESLIEKLTQYKKSLIYECVTGKRKVVK